MLATEWGVGNSLLLERMYISIVILESNIENVPYPAILLLYTASETYKYEQRGIYQDVLIFLIVPLVCAHLSVYSPAMLVKLQIPELYPRPTKNQNFWELRLRSLPL